MPFLMNEDAALKRKLQGLFVHDSTSGTAGRQVTVRFRNPEYEMADAVFPLALIEHTRIARDPEREMRGRIKIGYSPEGYAPWPDYEDRAASPYYSESPIPLNIDYQVDFFARKQTHLIELTGALMGFHYLTERFGYLAVPEDNSVRRLDVLGGPEYSESKDDRNKRLFTASYSLRISGEFFWREITNAAPAVQAVMIDLITLYDPNGGTPLPQETP